jgi:hypothetical protein
MSDPTRHIERARAREDGFGDHRLLDAAEEKRAIRASVRPEVVDRVIEVERGLSRRRAL